MNKYKFNIEEILNKEVTVEAEGFDQAMKIIAGTARQMGVEIKD